LDLTVNVNVILPPARHPALPPAHFVWRSTSEIYGAP
jgi:hypothetical protein